MLCILLFCFGSENVFLYIIIYFPSLYKTCFILKLIPYYPYSGIISQHEYLQSFSFIPQHEHLQHTSLFIHLFIIINCFIMVRVVVDLDPISARLSTRQEREYTLDGMPVRCRAPCAHTWGQFVYSLITSLFTDLFLGSWRKPKNMEETHMDTGKPCETPRRQ